MTNVEKAVILSAIEHSLVREIGVTFFSEDESDFVESIIGKHYGGFNDIEGAVKFTEDMRSVGLRLLAELRESEAE